MSFLTRYNILRSVYIFFVPYELVVTEIIMFGELRLGLVLGLWLVLVVTISGTPS